MKKIILIIMLMAVMIIEISYGATGHINGCPNTGFDTSCCTETFDIVADEGYEIVDVLVNGVSQGAISSYTFTNIIGPQTLKVITRKLGSIISYNANGGSGAPENQEKIHGVNLTLSSTIPTRSRYNFTGWNTAIDGSGTSYSAGGSFTTDADTTLYAQWENPLALIPVGAYVAYTPSITSYTVSTTASGHTTDQTYNPSTYNQGWKVFKNNDGQLDIISAESIGKLTLKGATGYAKAVKTLNNLSEAYKNPTYADGARSLGYDGAVDEITTPKTWSYTFLNSGSYGGDENVVGIYGDITYLSDISIINANSGLRQSSGNVWLASRFLYSYTGCSYLNVRCLYSEGKVYEYLLYTSYSDGGSSTYSYALGVRPIVSLKSVIQISGGSGTQADPYRISI